MAEPEHRDCVCKDTCERGGARFPAEWGWRCRGLPRPHRRCDKCNCFLDGAFHNDEGDCLIPASAMRAPVTSNPVADWTSEDLDLCIDEARYEAMGFPADDLVHAVVAFLIELRERRAADDSPDARPTK